MNLLFNRLTAWMVLEGGELRANAYEARYHFPLRRQRELRLRLQREAKNLVACNQIRLEEPGGTTGSSDWSLRQSNTV